jgi:hypothetical protein
VTSADKRIPDVGLAADAWASDVDAAVDRDPTR